MVPVGVLRGTKGWRARPKKLPNNVGELYPDLRRPAVLGSNVAGRGWNVDKEPSWLSHGDFDSLARSGQVACPSGRQGSQDHRAREKRFQRGGCHAGPTEDRSQ